MIKTFLIAWLMFTDVLPPSEKSKNKPREQREDGSN
jgi:hypothetical protein